MELLCFFIGLGVITLIVGIWGYGDIWITVRVSKSSRIMEAIIVGSVFCAFCLGIYLFANTKAGKKFFELE